MHLTVCPCGCELAVRLVPGVEVYVVRYLATGQIRTSGKFDAVYWRATGVGPFGINRAEVRVTLPQPVSFEKVEFFTGSHGAIGNLATVVEQNAEYVVVRTTDPLPPKSGLTVSVAWPKGIVTLPPPTAVNDPIDLPPDPRSKQSCLLSSTGSVLFAGFTQREEE